MSPIVSRERVRERLRGFIEEIAGIPAETIQDTSTIDNDLQMKSIAFVELQVAIEDEYEIRLDPVHIVELNEFSAIVEYICETAESSQ